MAQTKRTKSTCSCLPGAFTTRPSLNTVRNSLLKVRRHGMSKTSWQRLMLDVTSQFYIDCTRSGPRWPMRALALRLQRHPLSLPTPDLAALALAEQCTSPSSATGAVARERLRRRSALRLNLGRHGRRPPAVQRCRMFAQLACRLHSSSHYLILLARRIAVPRLL